MSLWNKIKEHTQLSLQLAAVASTGYGLASMGGYTSQVTEELNTMQTKMPPKYQAIGTAVSTLASIDPTMMVIGGAVSYLASKSIPVEEDQDNHVHPAPKAA